MSSLNEQHRQAMELAEQAFIARQHNDLAAARSLAYRAFALEKQAAEQAQTEPTRSVLHRSAATLALDCGEYRAAERLVAALAGTPPEPIANATSSTKRGIGANKPPPAKRNYSVIILKTPCAGSIQASRKRRL